MNYKEMKVAIAGYGIEGQSAEKYWKAQGSEVLIFDDDPSKGSAGKIEEISDVDLIVRSPAIRPDRLPKSINVTSVTREFFEKCQAKIIGVTGTKGKGTTCSLVYELLKASGIKSHLLGNIGTPALGELENISEDDYVVYELSSFQLWDLPFSPQIAVVLMVEQEHLDLHAHIEEYVDAKANIVKSQKQDDLTVYHPSNPLSEKIASLGHGQKIRYMTEDSAYINGDKIYIGDQEVCSLSEVKLIGSHNLENVCAALAVVSRITDDYSAFKNVLMTFKGLPHRLHEVAVVDNVTYIDDSISTIPRSAIAAIKSFKRDIVLILGGSDKKSDYSELIEEITTSENVTNCICIGETGQTIYELLKSAGFESIHKAGDMPETVNLASELAKPGDIVLLSPASASFDMFDSYKQRGDVFASLAREL